MLASERYYELTRKKYVYNIMPIENIPSVLKHGIVCFDRMRQFHHSPSLWTKFRSAAIRW